MTDTASASLPDVEGLQAPPQAPPGELPDVDSLSDAPAAQPGFGGAVMQPGFRGARGGIPNIPDAAAARFRESDSVANIFKAAGTRAAGNFVNTFNDLTTQDQQMLVANGYGNYTGAGGGIVQHAADAINSGYYLITDGFMAGGAALSGAVAGAEGQLIRETGGTETEAQRGEREGEFIGMAAQSDVGAMHGLSMLDAAKAQMTAPGIWANGYRIDQTEGGALVRTPLGKFPDAGAEAVAQSKTAADALHLGPDTATLIHQTYLDTGRPPAETLMDAKTNAGGVLDKLVAGEQPYTVPNWPEPTGPSSPVTGLRAEIAKAERDRDAAASSSEGPAQPPASLPPVSEGSVRLYHGGEPGEGARSFTSDYAYARAYADKSGAPVSYVDVSKTHPAIEMPDPANGIAGNLNNVELPGEVAEGAKKVPESTPTSVEGLPQQLLMKAREGGAIIPATELAAPEKTMLENAGVQKDENGNYYAQSLTDEADRRIKDGTWDTKMSVYDNSHLPQAIPEQGISKIGQSIEQKAIDAGITDGFLQTAGYDVKTVKGQTALVSDLITNSPEKMQAIVNGEQPLPHGMDPSMFITGVEEYIKQTKDWDLAGRLANSPVVTKTSEAGQTMRFAQEREPDSATAKLAELKQSQIKAAGGPAEVAKKQTQAKAALKEAGNNVFLPKEDLRWEKFLDEIRC